LSSPQSSHEDASVLVALARSLVVPLPVGDMTEWCELTGPRVTGSEKLGGVQDEPQLCPVAGSTSGAWVVEGARRIGGSTPLPLAMEARRSEMSSRAGSAGLDGRLRLLGWLADGARWSGGSAALLLPIEARRSDISSGDVSAAVWWIESEGALPDAAESWTVERTEETFSPAFPRSHEEADSPTEIPLLAAEIPLLATEPRDESSSEPLLLLDEQLPQPWLPMPPILMPPLRPPDPPNFARMRAAASSRRRCWRAT